MLYNIVLVSAVQQCESVMALYIYPLPPTPSQLPIPPLYIVTDHQAGLPVLYSNFPLFVYFIHNSVYMSMILCQFVPPQLPLLCAQVHSLHLRLHSFHAIGCVVYILINESRVSQLVLEVKNLATNAGDL